MSAQVISLCEHRRMREDSQPQPSAPVFVSGGFSFTVSNTSVTVNAVASGQPVTGFDDA